MNIIAQKKLKLGVHYFVPSHENRETTFAQRSTRPLSIEGLSFSPLHPFAPSSAEQTGMLKSPCSRGDEKESSTIGDKRVVDLCRTIDLGVSVSVLVLLRVGGESAFNADSFRHRVTDPDPEFKKLTPAADPMDMNVDPLGSVTTSSNTEGIESQKVSFRRSSFFGPH